MIFGVATNTVARDDIVVQVALEFAGDGDGVAVNRGSQVWPLESLGEDSGAFVGRPLVGLIILPSLSFPRRVCSACVCCLAGQHLCLSGSVCRGA